jgi:hypothetical protein
MATGQLAPDEVQIGTANGPGIYLAPAGTAGPEDTLEPWGEAWDVLGYLSDDGPTVGQATDSSDITPWQSVVPIRSVITSRGVTLQFTMWQLNAITLALYFDADVPEVGTDGEISMEVRSDAPQHIYAVGIDSRDAERVLRITFPRASLTTVGDMQIQRGAAIPLDVTLSALDDAGLLADVKLGPAPEIEPMGAASLSSSARAQRARARTAAPASAGTSGSE